jgi:glutathione-regulated potassium-efflux system ancillary protein KefG
VLAHRPGHLLTPANISGTVTPVNYPSRMAPLVDPDELLDAQSVAEMLNFASRNVVSVYRSRHADFPEPVVNLGPGRPMLWLRRDIAAWASRHPARRR